jgi:hypothetical protein
VVRTVRVRLELDRDSFKQGLRDSAASMRTFDGDVKTLGKDAERTGVELKQTGTQVGKLGDDVKRSSRDVTVLTRSLDDSRKSLRDLGDEYKKTGAVELDRYRSLTSELRKLERAKRDLDRLGGNNQSGLLGGTLGKGLNALSGGAAIPSGMWQWLGTGAMAAAPAIGAAVNAGILLGVGSGGLAAGIVGALQDPRVKASWSDFGGFLKSGLADASTGFQAPMLQSVIIIRAAMSRMFTDLGHSLDLLGPVLTHLASGVAGLFTNMSPGLNNALRAAVPIMDALAAQLPKLGSAMSFFFDQMAAGGPGATRFFNDLMSTVEGTIGLVGVLTASLSKMYDVLRPQMSAAGLLGPTGALLDYIEADKKKKTADDDAAQAAADHRVAMTDEAFAAGQAKMSIDQLNAAIDAEVSKELAAHNAHLQLNQSLLDLTASVKENGTSLDDTTAAGIANSNAILRGAAAAEADRVATLARTGSTEAATAAFDADMAKLYAHADALHFDRGKVDALAGSVRSIPHESAIDIQLRGDKVAEDDIRTYKNFLNSIPTSKTTYIDVVQRHSTVGGPTAFARGGVVAYAQGGVEDYKMSLRTDYTARSGLLKPSNPGTILAGEPSTGGEVFGPRLGVSHERGLQLAGVLAGWHGGMVVRAGPMGGGGGGGTVVNNSFTINAGMGTDGTALGRQIADALRPYIRSSGGGNVQVALGKRGA